MANAALLGGLLKGFGAAQAAQQARQFQAEQMDKARRLSILQAAASNPSLDPSALPGIFQQMEEIYAPGGKSRGGSKNSAAPSASPTPPPSQAVPGASGGATPVAPSGGAPPQPPQGFLSRFVGGIEHHLRSGIQGARQGYEGETGANQPPAPPIRFLTPEQRGAQAAEISVAQQQRIATFREGVAKRAGLAPGSEAYSDYVLTGKLPTTFGEFKLSGYGPAMTVPEARALHPQAMAAPGVPLDWSTIPKDAYVKFSLGSDGLYYASPVAPPQLSPSSISSQLQAAYAALQNPQTSAADRQAAVLTIQHYDPTRVRTNTTTHISTITNPDGSTFQVAIPVTNTSRTSAPVPVGAQAPAQTPIPAARRAKTPPEPPAALQGGGASHVSGATPIGGTQGHKTLPAQAERQLSGAATLAKFADDVVTALKAAGANPSDNGWLSALRGRAQQLLYNQGLDTALAPVSNLSGLMQAMAAATIGTGRMNSQLLDIAGLHVPGANQTPAAIAARAALVKHAAQTVMQQIGDEYGVDVDQNGHPTLRSTPAAPLIDPKLKSSHPKAAEWLQGIQGGGGGQ